MQGHSDCNIANADLARVHVFVSVSVSAFFLFLYRSPSSEALRLVSRACCPVSGLSSTMSCVHCLMPNMSDVVVFCRFSIQLMLFSMSTSRSMSMSCSCLCPPQNDELRPDRPEIVKLGRPTRGSQRRIVPGSCSEPLFAGSAAHYSGTMSGLCANALVASALKKCRPTGLDPRECRRSGFPPPLAPAGND